MEKPRYFPPLSSKPGGRLPPCGGGEESEGPTSPQAPVLAYPSTRPGPGAPGGFHSIRLPKGSYEPRPLAHLSTDRLPWPQVTTGTLGSSCGPGLPAGSHELAFGMSQCGQIPEALGKVFVTLRSQSAPMNSASMWAPRTQAPAMPRTRLTTVDLGF